MLSTHIDCVPPFLPSRVEGGRLHGRGACDAKGILAAQVAAVERLRASGEERVGLLFVVGEERGSDGAAAADALAPGVAVPGQRRADRQPAGRRQRAACCGVQLQAAGKAAHSSHPQRGESAIDKLLDALVALRALPLPDDPQLGRTFYCTGLISGGIAPNVVSPHAEAELIVPHGRAGGPTSCACLEPLRGRRRARARARGAPGAPAHGARASRRGPSPSPPTSRCSTGWGRPLLFGPGSILVAHTDDEHVELDELEASVSGYERIARALLRDASAS